ncbi:MAG: peptide chain release factor N(5)-glutamine methyltransferase [Blautia sp.]|uniref:peptide chain release factor N(5)-glutamine methyltransferase n=1 Tax=Blautia sp. TaxID=1955243 RepID=UPI002A75F96F|nr:peptide chain release factor N(5)-glutamine methyltransferase [Blautia sp.]MDY3016054.1 peptide chain release factor N(5)-glutamine methyltransferase [Blautia sp.]
MKTFESLFREGCLILETAGIEEARLDAWLLLEYVTGKNRAWYFAHSDEPVQEEDARQYKELCRKRSVHTPLQHLTQSACFMGYDFYVDENVLVPRQDTETLVEEALKLLKDQPAPSVLDMCTGSGCILLSILKEIPDAGGVGSDLSEAALKVAEKNAERLQVQERAFFTHSDLFSGEYFTQNSSKKQTEYDMLISNPPYIATEEIQKLMEEVRLHDPYMALDGKEDGLYFYRSITAQCSRYLKPGGWLLYEIGYDQGASVSDIMKKAGFVHVTVKKDLAGLDRVVLGQKKKREEQNV